MSQMWAGVDVGKDLALGGDPEVLDLLRFLQDRVRHTRR